jgi:hypothetical protein
LRETTGNQATTRRLIIPALKDGALRRHQVKQTDAWKGYCGQDWPPHIQRASRTTPKVTSKAPVQRLRLIFS